MRNAGEVVEIWRQIELPNNTYDEDSDEIVSMGKVHARAETGTSDPDEPDPSKMARRTSTATFRVPLGADVRLGDQIEWAGARFHVSDQWSNRMHRVVQTVRV